ncbi:hypothetical protein Afe04nite_83660 [Asanoa ferruginea]|uniref:hypothetical protein n=1 Tax=Asanoa ferruginea TaxID=53367 RepID=UPI001943D821|nr:hypothetical protein [Asanoa ferruginea]GIF53827.1 hypothetical protein Afe04nite_83660 [Asanoa ferruginea]
MTWDPYNPDPAYPPQPGGAGGVPPGGYLPPPQFGPQTVDPLVSPDYSGWWGRATTIVRHGWKPLATIQALGLVLSLLLQAPVGIYVAFASDDLQRAFPEPGTTSGQADLTPFFVALGLGVGAALLGVLVTSMVTLAVVHVGASVAIGAPVRIDDALRLAARRIFPLIGWQLLTIPIYLVGLCLCVLPVFYVAAVFAVLPVVVAAERTGAVGRCFTLFHRNLGVSAGRLATILGLTLAVGLIGAVFSGIIEAGTSAGSSTAATVVGVVVSTLISAALSGALAILVAPLTLTAYADMRARTEPFNAMVIAQELGIVQPQSPWSEPWPPAAAT